MQLKSNQSIIEIKPTTLSKHKGVIYTKDWFSHNIPNWRIWLKKFKNKENMSFLEIGCYEGMATKWLLDNILTNSNSRITVVDTFNGSIEHQKFDNTKMLVNFINNVGSDKRLRIFSTTSKHFLKTTDELYNFIYIDASHKAKDVMADAILAWDKLKRSGILIFDDYEWKKFPKTSNLHPKMAIDCFLEMYREEYKLIGKNYQVCIMKTIA